MTPAFTFAKAIAREGALGPSRNALRGKKKGNKARKNPRIDYFRGPRCNQDWFELESVEAKRLRGRGFMSFVALIHRERPKRCEGRCGVHRSALNVYHVLGPIAHRHLRFERSNVLLLCKECKVKFEQGVYRNQASIGAAVAGNAEATCKSTRLGPTPN